MRKAVLAFSILLGISAVGSAQNVDVDSLVEQDINSSLEQDGVNFQTDYLNKTVPYKDVFIPEQYHHYLADFDVNYKNTENKTNQKFSIDFSFQDVDNSSLPNKLDGYSYSADFKNKSSIDGGEASWTIQSDVQQVSGNPIQEDADYDLKITGNNEEAQVDGSLNRVNGSTQIVNDGSLNFNASAETFAFDSGVFKPRIRSHYEHLIIRHEVRTSVSPKFGETLKTTENVYSGEDTNLATFSGSSFSWRKIDELGDFRNYAEVKYDNRYEKRQEITAYAVYNKNLSLEEFKTDGENLEKVDKSYSSFRDRAIQLGMSEKALVNNSDEYKVETYNITVSNDSVADISYYLNTRSNEDFYLYIRGSAGGGGGSASWETGLSGLKTPRVGHTVSSDGKGRLYAIGGSDPDFNTLDTVERYSVTNDSWTNVANLPQKRSDHMSATGPNGDIYVFSGRDRDGNPQSTAYKYDVSEGFWTNIQSVPNIRTSGGAVTGPNGDIYLVGGDDLNGDVLDEVDKYDPETDSYTSLPLLPRGVHTLSVASTNGKIYAIGGRDSASNVRDLVQVYDPSTGSWSKATPLPEPRYRAASSVGPNGNIYVIGGVNTSFTIDNAVFKYNPDTDSWSTGPTMPAPFREELGSATGPSGKIYAVGGSDNSDPFAQLVGTNQALTFNSPPNVSFTSNSPVLTGNDLGLDASGSSDPDGDSLSYAWDFFNDGTTDASVVAPSKSFADNQTLNVALTVTDGNGGSDTVIKSVTIENRNPSASFTFSKSDKTLSVDTSGSTDQDGSISSVDIDYDNDGTFEGSGTTDSFTYSSGGSKTVTVKTTDDDGATDSVTQNVDINKDPLISASKYIDDRTSGKTELEFSLNDRTESDISSFSAAFSASTFTNSSLRGGISLPFSDTVTVSDSPGASVSRSVDISETDSGLQERSVFSHTLGTQRIERDVTISNGDSNSIDYSLTTDLPGSNVIQGQTFTGTISGSSSVTETSITEDDFITGETESTFNRFSDTGFDQGEDQQRIVNRTQLLADNSRSFQFTGVDISTVCSQTSSTDVPAGSGVTVTNDCKRPTFLVDKITQSVSSEFEDGTFGHDLGTQGLAKSKDVTEASGQFSFSNVDVSAPSISGTLQNGGTRQVDLSAGSTVTELYNATGDFIKNENEQTFSRFSDTGFNHGENQQVIINRTQLVVDNTKSFEFGSVDVSSQCSQTSSTNVPSGNGVTATNDCNRPSFTVDKIGQSTSSIFEDSTFGHDLETQGVAKNKTVSEDSGSFSFSGVNVSTPTVPGTVQNGGQRQVDLVAGGSVTEIYNATSDFITNEREQTFNRFSDSDFNHGENTQRIQNRTKLVADNSRSFSFSGVDVSNKCNQTGSTDVSSGNNVLVTNDCNRPTFTVDKINQSVSTQFEDSTFDHGVDTQGIARNKTLSEESGSFTFSGVNVSAPSVSGSLQNPGQRQVDIPSGGSVTETYNATGDFISETKRAFEPTVDEVKISGNYSGFRDVELSNERNDVGFSGVDTSGVGLGPAGCTQVNSTSVDLPSNTKKNVSTGYKCDAGTKGTPVQTIIENSPSPDFERVWYNTTWTLNTNETKNKPIVWNVNESNVKKFNSRQGGSWEVYIDGKETDITLNDLNDIAQIKVQTDFGNSSLESGDHKVGMTYYYSTGSSTSTGGGGGGAPSPETTRPGSTVVFDRTVYTVTKGTVGVRNFALTNVANQDTLVEVSVPDTRQCRPFSLETGFGTDEFGKKVNYTVPSASDGINGEKSVIRPTVQVDFSNVSTEGLENDTFTCTPTVGVSEGTPPTATFEASVETGTVAEVKQFFKSELGVNLDKNLFSQSFCTGSLSAVTDSVSGQVSEDKIVCGKGSELRTFELSNGQGLLLGTASMLVLIGLGYRRE